MNDAVNDSVIAKVSASVEVNEARRFAVVSVREREAPVENVAMRDSGSLICSGE